MLRRRLVLIFRLVCLLFTFLLISVLSSASFLSLSTFLFCFPSFLFCFRFIVTVSFCIVLHRTKQLFAIIFYLCYFCFQFKFAYIIARYGRYVVANINLSKKNKNNVKSESLVIYDFWPFSVFYILFSRPFSALTKCLISQCYLSYLTRFFFFDLSFHLILLHYFWPLVEQNKATSLSYLTASFSHSITGNPDNTN